jgi:Domain of unknown function (DUF6089)
MLFIKKWAALMLFLVTFSSQAQDTKLFSRKNLANQYATFGIGGGSSHYYGDLSPYSTPWIGIYTNVRWNGTMNYTRHLSPKLSARVSASYIRIAGDDNVYAKQDKKSASSRILRNLNFRNDIQEIGIMGLYNLAPQYGKGPNGRNQVMPYATFGIAVFGHNPKALGVNNGVDKNDTWIALKPLNTGGQGQVGSKKPYSYVSVAIPIGLGVRYKLNNNFDLAIEGGLRLTYFDYLDDVGADAYPDASTFSDPTAAKLSYRADELFEPKSGINRISKFINASLDVNPGTTYLDPTNDAKLAYPLTTLRGTDRKDSYIVTQITLNYVIGKSIKCPPIR